MQIPNWESQLEVSEVWQVEEVQPPWQSERVSKLANNPHWRPITTNCNLCRQRYSFWVFSLIVTTSSRYSIVMHLDTLARDMAYLSQKLNLNIDPGFIRREGGGGRTSQNRWKPWNAFVCPFQDTPGFQWSRSKDDKKIVQALQIGLWTVWLQRKRVSCAQQVLTHPLSHDPQTKDKVLNIYISQLGWFSSEIVTCWQ